MLPIIQLLLHLLLQTIAQSMREGTKGNFGVTQNENALDGYFFCSILTFNYYWKVQKIIWSI